MDQFSKKQGLLVGKVIGVSSFNSENKKELTYEDIKRQVEEIGGKVSGIVHKKVFAVVATDQAVEQKTQRVRKALKFGISLMKPSWIKACIKSGRIVDRNDKRYTHSAAEPSEDNSLGRKNSKRKNNDIEKELKCMNDVVDGDFQKKAKKKDKQNEKKTKLRKTKNDKEDDDNGRDEFKDDETLTSITGWEPKIELGCCCSCHDDNKPHCDWCIDSHEKEKQEKKGK